MPILLRLFKLQCFAWLGQQFCCYGTVLKWIIFKETNTQTNKHTVYLGRGQHCFSFTSIKVFDLVGQIWDFRKRKAEINWWCFIYFKFKRKTNNFESNELAFHRLCINRDHWNDKVTERRTTLNQTKT